MFIELAEWLRCPGAHADTYCVVSSEHMKGRDIVRGIVGCPACKAEYVITESVVEFGDHPLCVEGFRADDAEPGDAPNAETLQALLALDGPGGYLVLVGSVSRMAAELVELVDGVHLVGVNVPPDVRPTSHLSVLTAPDTIPLRTSKARGAVISREYAATPWLQEAARVARPGTRIVTLEDVHPVEGVRELATAERLWVGERTSLAQSR